MKQNMIHLDPEMAAALGECKVGQTKDVTFRITVDKMDDGMMATVQNVVDYEDPEDGDGSGMKMAGKGPKKPMPPMKRAKALEEAIDESY